MAKDRDMAVITHNVGDETEQVRMTRLASGEVRLEIEKEHQKVSIILTAVEWARVLMHG